MATRLFSSIVDGSVLAFDPLADLLRFDDPAVSAAQLALGFAADGTQVGITAAGRHFTLTPTVSVTQLSTLNLSFADGSRLLIGDNRSAADDAAGNTLTGTGKNDQLLGLGGNDSLSGGAGNDRLDGGLGHDTLMGGSGNDALLGAGGNDLLDGGAGNDTMRGGAGQDRYVVDAPGDVVSETGTLYSEIDTVLASVSWELSAHLERLTLRGSAAIDGHGNALGNLILGNGAANQLAGHDGNDTLDGGGAADTLIGGAGDDLFVVDSTGDVLLETENGGRDGVHTTLDSFSLVFRFDVEDLSYTGNGNFQGSGNELPNAITGGVGDDTLDGGLGEDVDTLTGGAGDDVYFIDFAGKVVVEAVDGGFDWIRTSLPRYTLGNTLEGLIYSSGSPFAGTGDGHDNYITSGPGNDTLDGAGGSDTLFGGSGDDVYLVDAAGDSINEGPGAGHDLVRSSVDWTLGAELERLELSGTARAGTGNGLDNLLSGNAAGNVLAGEAGNDTLIGGSGADRLSGGAGSDVFRIVAGGADTITDFDLVADHLQLGMSYFRVGDGDTRVEGALQRAASGGFGAANELVIFTQNLASLGSSAAPAGIGTATAVLPTGLRKVFVVDNGVNSAVYLFTSADNNAVVSAAELTLAAQLTGVTGTTGGDFLFMA